MQCRSHSRRLTSECLFVTACSMDEYAEEKKTEKNLIVRSGISEAETTNRPNKRLRSTFCIEAIHEASCGIFATAEFLVRYDHGRTTDGPLSATSALLALMEANNNTMKLRAVDSMAKLCSRCICTSTSFTSAEIRYECRSARFARE